MCIRLPQLQCSGSGKSPDTTLEQDCTNLYEAHLPQLKCARDTIRFVEMSHFRCWISTVHKFYENERCKELDIVHMVSSGAKRVLFMLDYFNLQLSNRKWKDEGVRTSRGSKSALIHERPLVATAMWGVVLCLHAGCSYNCWLETESRRRVLNYPCA
jgi:hypothetical protein